MGKMQIGTGENGWRLFIGVLFTAEREKGEKENAIIEIKRSTAEFIH